MNFVMKRSRKLLTITLVFLMLFSSLLSSIGVNLASAEEVNNEETVQLKVLHTNDLHAKINDFGKIAAYINSERENATHSLYLDAGDIFSGNPVVDLQYGVPIVDLLNDMGLQAMAIGNHDFDYGQEETVNRIAQSNFHWLSANTVVNDTPVEDFPQPEPYNIFDVNGITVGVLAVTETPPSTAPANVVGISFNDPIETIKRYEFLKDEVDVLIGLTHHGYSEDIKLAEQVDFLDVIIGGHSHTVLSSPRVVNGTPIVQTGGNAENVGNLTLSIDPETKSVVEVNGHLQRVSELTEVDEAIQAKVDAYNSEMDGLLGRVIGSTETGLNRSGNGDTSLGNFWTDAMRHFTSSDIAFTNGGGIRANIAAGDITVEDIYTIEPFANEIMKIEMTGAAIKDVIEYSYTRQDRNRIDLQSSGLSYTIVTNNTGRYITAELLLNGQPIEDDETYIVAVGDYIGTGGSGYNFVGNVLEAKSGFMTEAMINYAEHLTEEGQKINYTNNERIFIRVSNEAPIDGEVIGSTERGLSSANNSLGDSGLGNLYTDAVRAATDAELGMLNSSSVIGTIPAGPITDRQIEFLDQFGNVIVVAKTTVDRLKEIILEQSTYHNGVDVQVSGFHYELVKENGKFVDVIMTDEEGQPLDTTREYTVAYNDYMHGRAFYNVGNEVIIENGGPVWESVIDYVRNHDGPIDYVEGSRITISGETTPPTPGLPDGVITVAEAIANNSGTKTVQGYIIGTTGTTGSVGNGDLTAPFTIATNILLADNPNETDMSKAIPVQLPNTNIRTVLNLVDNPNNLGQLVRITGTLNPYFSVPGLRSANAYEFVQEEEEELTIQEARELAQGTTVTVKGIATTNAGAWGAKGFYIQDETAGIYVYQFDIDVKAGDEVTLTGTLGNFNGELQVSNPTNLQIMSEGNDIPEAIVISPATINADNEGQLVKIEEVTISNIKKADNFGTTEFTATKDGESILVRVDNRTGLHYDDFAFNEGDIVTVTGVSSQFRGTPQLKPRHAEDIVLVQPVVPVEASVHFVNNNGEEVVALQRKTDVDVQVNLENNVRVEQTVNVAVQLVDKHGRVKHSTQEEVVVAEQSLVVYSTSLQVPANHVGQRYTLTVTVENEQGEQLTQSVIK
ncbi:5'-nucleotidase C-terminal domain-containing protein [Sutcliffiella sp. NC1]|uniref:5'-nucleotidase C-terminal domain-containing protein n=1 Tax=Sutcliffiella sp. NC1 TaxID=3004096 RepID=UPI0022DD7167|nr:5'-nucleotidase C-terminal domain-containing protein [Sutcliffiella sp. NC1]WBL14390.1 5'-nucleotidase C-terminal domain-containing protein [Sutcliffiella sp. NC1]